MSWANYDINGKIIRFYAPYYDPIVLRIAELPMEGILRRDIWVSSIFTEYKFFAYKGYEFILN